MKVEKNLQIKSEVVSNRYVYTVLGSVALLTIVLGLIVGYVFFWDQPAFKSVEDYQVQSAFDAVKKFPKDAQLRVELGWALLNTGQYDRAIEEYKNALKIDPKNAGAKLNIAIAKTQQKKFAEAKKELEKLVKDNSAFIEARVALGNVYYETKEYNKAIEQYQFALNANPGTVDYIMAIGKIYEAKGDKANAIKNYKRAVEYIPTYQPAKEALKALGVKTDSGKK